MPTLIQTVWITKYALTTGVFKKEVKVFLESDDALTVVKEPGEHMTLYSRDEWQSTRVAAVARAEEMRLRKIVSLERQRARLLALNFNYSVPS